MPRSRRVALGGNCYHVLNRGNCRNTVFLCPEDYEAFAMLIGEGNRRFRMRLLAYCLMPNHFHLVLWPRGDRDIGDWLRWVLTTHVRRHHKRHGTDGRIWQGRGIEGPELSGLVEGPLPKYLNWLEFVNEPLTVGELAAVRKCISRQSPYGAEGWSSVASARHGLRYPLAKATGGRPRSS